MGHTFTGRSWPERTCTEADLHGAILIGADVRGTMLNGCDLHEAGWHGANLQETDSTKADLYGAVLIADLHAWGRFDEGRPGWRRHAR